MRNIDIRVLREAAEKALNARARLALMQSVFDDDGDVIFQGNLDGLHGYFEVQS